MQRLNQHTCRDDEISELDVITSTEEHMLECCLTSFPLERNTLSIQVVANSIVTGFS